MNRMTVRLAATVCAATLGSALTLAAGAAPASAAPASSTTQTFHQSGDLGSTTIGSFGNPCTGDSMSGTASTNLVVHQTVQGDQVWFTLTETDKVVATDVGTGETFTGNVTAWFNSNVNQQNENFTFITEFHLRGDQGDTIGYSEVGHGAKTPSGQIAVFFDKPTTTCGS